MNYWNSKLFYTALFLLALSVPGRIVTFSTQFERRLLLASIRIITRKCMELDKSTPIAQSSILIFR
jgi:hypothetical protein